MRALHKAWTMCMGIYVYHCHVVHMEMVDDQYGPHACANLPAPKVRAEFTIRNIAGGNRIQYAGACAPVPASIDSAETI